MYKKLSILIPVYNEESTIKEVLKRVQSVPTPPLKKEIIIVDDFSTDNTRETLKRMDGNNVKIFFHKKNMGKGSAIRTALKHATGDIIIIQDADLEYSPEEYPKLLKPILDKKTKVVYGSRFTKKHKAKYKLYYLGNLFLTFMTNLIFNSNITDMETCYKVFTKDIINKIKLRAKRFDLEPEITAKILKNRYKIIEVPISYQCRDIEEGKKITWKDGVLALYYLFKYRFTD